MKFDDFPTTNINKIYGLSNIFLFFCKKNIIQYIFLIFAFEITFPCILVNHVKNEEIFRSTHSKRY